MSRRSARTDAALPLGLAALAFLLAFVQRPGWAASDTKIDLHVDPWRFLGDVTSTWTASGSLGHVQGGQYSGYLFPMGPFFAAGHALGLGPWVVHRLWLGALLALAAWARVGPLLLLAWEPLMGDVPWRASARFAVRAGAAALVASLWWAAPVLVQALYGIDFLKFTEQPGTIWATTSVSETLRLM